MIVKEQLNGGLVQTRHSTLLRAGELQTANDTILRPGDPAIHKAPGRTAFGTVRSTAVTCTSSNGSATLTSTNAFGTDIASVTVVAGNPVITKASAFGAVAVGQSVWGASFAAGTYVRRVIDTSNVELNIAPTSGGTVTVTFSDFFAGTYITGAGITTGTYIISIASASSLTMSAVGLSAGAGAASRTFSERIQGLRSLFFDGAVDDLLLVKAADKLYTAPATAITGTFTSRLVGLTHDADATLETIHLKDRHVILTGFNNPRVLYYKDDNSTGQAPFIRTFGMQPVVNFIGATTFTPGTWSSLEKFQNGWYHFLVVEVAIFGKDDEIEGTYTGDPVGVYMDDYTSKGIRITYRDTGSTPVNDGLYGRNTATHWRVYMSPRQESEMPAPDLASFRRVAEVPFALTAGALTAPASIDLKDTNPFQFGWAAVLAANASDDALFPAGTTNALSQVAGQTVANCTTTEGSTTLTTTGTFATVVPGMAIISTTDNRIPYGTTVTSKESTTSLTMSSPANSAGTETVGFSDRDSFDNVFASCPRNAGVVRRGGKFQNFNFQNIGGFPSGTVTGIKVEIKGRFVTNSVADPGFFVAVSRDGTTFSADRTGQFKTNRTLNSIKQGDGIISLGGEFDTWGVAWVPADFTNGAAKCNIRLRKAFGVHDTENSHAIDGVKITVYCGGSSINLDGDPFPTVIVSDQLGNSFGSPAGGPPPVASTGDILDGMLILNDTAAESDIVASLPDDEEQFPDVYRLHLNKNARVRVIRRVANGMVILCQESIKRLSYFPTEENATSAQGRCYEEIASDHGVVGSRAAVLLDLPGRGSILAYLSHKGLMWTDGVTTVPMNEDIAWTTLIDPAYIQQTVLEVYPRLSLLCIQYVPTGGTRKTKALWLSYHPTHIKEGFRLPAVGPVSMNGESACNSLITGASYFFSGNSLDGKVYVEDSGTTDDSGLDGILPTVKTRRFFLADLGFEGRVERVFIIADVAGTSVTGVFTATFTGQDSGDAGSTRGTDTGSTELNSLIKLHLDNEAELFDLQFAKTAAQSASFRLHYIGYEVTPMSQDTT